MKPPVRKWAALLMQERTTHMEQLDRRTKLLIVGGACLLLVIAIIVLVVSCNANRQKEPEPK